MTDTIDTSIIRLQNGDKTAFDQIYNDTYRIVYACSFKMLKNEQDTCDAVQNIYIKMLMKLDTLKDISKFNGWLMAITYNECKNVLKSRQRCVKSTECDNDISDIEEFTNIQDDFSNPIDITDEKELKTDIKSIIDELPTEQKQVVLMYYYNQKTVEEIAKEFNCSTGTIKSRLNYARKNLKKSVSLYEKKNNIRLHSSFIPLLLADLKTQISSIFITKAVVVASTLVIGTTTVYSVNNYRNSKPPIQSPSMNIVAEVTEETGLNQSLEEINAEEEKLSKAGVPKESEVANITGEVTTAVTDVSETTEVTQKQDKATIQETTVSDQTQVPEVTTAIVSEVIPQVTAEETTINITQQEVPAISEDSAPDDKWKEDEERGHKYFDNHDKMFFPSYEPDEKEDYDIPKDEVIEPNCDEEGYIYDYKDDYINW